MSIAWYSGARCQFIDHLQDENFSIFSCISDMFSCLPTSMDASRCSWRRRSPSIPHCQLQLWFRKQVIDKQVMIIILTNKAMYLFAVSFIYMMNQYYRFFPQFTIGLCSWESVCTLKWWYSESYFGGFQ